MGPSPLSASNLKPADRQSPVALAAASDTPDAEAADAAVDECHQYSQ